jgi:hypothetical protein
VAAAEAVDAVVAVVVSVVVAVADMFLLDKLPELVDRDQDADPEVRVYNCRMCPGSLRRERRSVVILVHVLSSPRRRGLLRLGGDCRGASTELVLERPVVLAVGQVGA